MARVSIISHSYIVDYLDVPNLVNAGIGTEIQVNIQRYIDQYEVEYLTLLLGETLYNEFEAGRILVPIATKWTDLLNKLRNTTTLKSAIANYCYEKYFSDNNIIAQGTGEESGTGFSPLGRITNIYHDLITWSASIYDWLEANKTIYTSFNNVEFPFKYGTYNPLGI